MSLKENLNPNPTVSIIMPVYGVEDYIGRAIESIQSQTFTDFEFFCVDDGSTDKSGEICDRYAKKDSRIHVIHKENGGAPDARNVAIDMATGKYLYFCDADDWAEPDMLEKMIEIAEENEAQLVVSGYYIDTYCNDGNIFTQEQYYRDRVYKSQKEFRECAYELFDENLLYTPWNKLYLTDYVKSNRLYFPKTFWDDFPFNLSVIKDIERVVVISDKYYHFIRQRAESETAKYRRDMYKKREEEASWLEDLYEHWGVNNNGSSEFLARRYVERVIGCIENVTNTSCTLSFSEKLTEIRSMISSERTRKALMIAEPKSHHMRLMLVPLKMRSVVLSYLEGIVISKVKMRNVKLFAELKANR